MTQQQSATRLAKADPRAIGMKSLVESPAFTASLAAALPRHITPERMVRVMMSAFQVNEKLLQCTPESIMLSLMRAAMMGLEPDGGVIGHGYLVPYWSAKRRRHECQFIPGYRGMVKLARNSGDILDVWAEVVYQGDRFSYSRGLDPSLIHEPNDERPDGAQPTHVYAVALFRGSDHRKFDVMRWADVLKIRDGSPGAHDRDGKLCGPWLNHPDEMGKKTVVRRLCKMLPLAADREQAIDAEHATIDMRAAMSGGGLIALPSPPGNDENDPDALGELLGDAFARLADCDTREALAETVKALRTKSSDADYLANLDQMAADRSAALPEPESKNTKKGSDAK